MYYEDFSVGQIMEVEPVLIERDEMLSFARRYDPLPIHLDEEYAKTTRFHALIAPGVMSFMSCWERFLRLDPFGQQLVAGTSTKIEWFAPVYAGDVLHGIANVVEKTERNKYNGTLVINLKIYNSDGVHIIDSFIETVVERRPLL
jgi:3-hydroxybutyryl-CoA dehydratase